MATDDRLTVSPQESSMVTASRGSDKVGSSREASLAVRSGKPRSWSEGPELLDLVSVEGDGDGDGGGGPEAGGGSIREGKAQPRGIKDRTEM